MEDNEARPAARGSLSHSEVQRFMETLGDSGILNLDTSLRQVMGPVKDLLRPDLGNDTVSLHIVCCNEYGLVTP